MKAIIAYSFVGAGEPTSAGRNFTFDVVPDSAIVRAKDPFFIPYESRWMAIPLRGVIIDRLGKGISRKFASRYYNNCLTAAHPFEDPSERTCDRFGHCRDGALVVSPHQPVGDSDVFAIIDEIIAVVSKEMTLKTGDLVLLGYRDNSFSLANQSTDYIIPAHDCFPEMKLKIR